MRGKDAKFEAITYCLQERHAILLVGTLAYNVERNQLCLTPSFLLSTLNPRSFSKTELLSSAYSYLGKRASSISSQQMVAVLVIGTLLLLRRKPIRGAFKAAARWVEGVFEPRKDRRRVFARKEDRLRCECGKTLNIIYQCGHLTTCQKCHSEAEGKVCSICNSHSREVETIFT